MVFLVPLLYWHKGTYLNNRIWTEEKLIALVETTMKNVCTVPVRVDTPVCTWVYLTSKQPHSAGDGEVTSFALRCATTAWLRQNKWLLRIRKELFLIMYTLWRCWKRKKSDSMILQIVLTLFFQNFAKGFRMYCEWEIYKK